MSNLEIVKATFDFYCSSLYHLSKTYICLTKVSFNALGLKDIHFHKQFYMTNVPKKVLI